MILKFVVNDVEEVIYVQLYIIMLCCVIRRLQSGGT